VDSAEVLFRQALDMRELLLPENDQRIAETHLRLSGLLTSRGRYADAKEGLFRALEIFELSGAPPVDLSAAANRLGQIFWIEGDLEGAEPYFRRALSERREYLEPDHPLVGESLNNLAVLLDDLGKAKEAEEMYRQALVVVEKGFGESSDQVAPILGNLALILSDRGEIQEADSLFLRALEIDEATFGSGHPNVALDKLNLGTHYCDTGRPEMGVDLTADALRVLRATLDSGQFEIGVAGSAYGMCLGRMGRFTEGERELLEALRIVAEALGPDHARLHRIRVRLADLYDAWGNPEQAERYRRD